MSDENETLIEKTFIDKVGAKYPFVKAKGCNRTYGIKYFPSLFVIDPEGNIVSVPDDGMPNEAMIEKLLQSVSLAPKLPEGAHYDPLRRLWSEKRYAAIAQYLDRMLQADKLEPDVREVFSAQKEELDRRIARQLARIEKLAKGPDFLRAQESLKKLGKEWKGLAVAEAAQKVLDSFAGDREIKKEIAASKKLAKLLSRYDPSKRSQARKLAEQLAKFASKYEGTFAGGKAKQMAGGR